MNQLFFDCMMADEKKELIYKELIFKTYKSCIFVGSCLIHLIAAGVNGVKKPGACLSKILLKH